VGVVCLLNLDAVNRDNSFGDTHPPSSPGRGTELAEVFGAKKLMTAMAHQFHLQEGNTIPSALNVCFILE